MQHPTDNGSGYTLIELVLVLTITSILSAVIVPGITPLLDGLAVRGALADAEAVFSAARRVALTRATQATVDIDTVARRLVVRVGHDTVRRQEVGLVHGVHLTTSRSPMTYAPTGMGYGTANLTLIITRHAAAETLTVSRLGRVR